MQRISERAALDQALAGRTVVALFHATWCPFCTSFVETFEQQAASRAGSIVAVEVLLDDEENPLWDDYAIAAVPTVIFFEDGKITRRLDAVRGVGLSAEGLAAAW